MLTFCQEGVRGFFKGLVPCCLKVRAVCCRWYSRPESVFERWGCSICRVSFVLRPLLIASLDTAHAKSKVKLSLDTVISNHKPHTVLSEGSASALPFVIDAGVRRGYVSFGLLTTLLEHTYGLLPIDFERI